jgi:hypothetical protein
MGDVSVADAIIKGIQGFDAETAYAAIRKDAMEAPPSGITGIGRGCLEAYQVNQVVVFTAARILSSDFYVIMCRNMVTSQEMLLKPMAEPALRWSHRVSTTCRPIMPSRKLPSSLGTLKMSTF